MGNAAVFRLVAGLGNPGRQYDGTRHNVGFLVLDELARRAAGEFRFEPKWNSNVLLCGGRMLMKPQTFMNLSGEAVGDYARYHRIPAEEVLVVFDDVALPLGELRIRKSGSSGGHNGIQSVMMHMGTEAVPRLRVGIGAATGELHDHVLGKFSPDESESVQNSILRAADAIEYANGHGIDAAMNIFNQKQTL